jgi:hypothetical protein
MEWKGIEERGYRNELCSVIQKTFLLFTRNTLNYSLSDGFWEYTGNHKQKQNESFHTKRDSSICV